MSITSQMSITGYRQPVLYRLPVVLVTRTLPDNSWYRQAPAGQADHLLLLCKRANIIHVNDFGWWKAVDVNGRNAAQQPWYFLV